MKLISYTRWYYDHASSYLPVLTDEAGYRSDWGKVEISLQNGESVYIRPATDYEHDRMCLTFDQTIDELAKEGFVYGIGNFDYKNPPPNVLETVTQLKREARINPRKKWKYVG